MITSALQAEIEREMKRQIASISPLSAANNARIYRLTFADKTVAVAKIAERSLDIEAFMLTYLKKNSKLPVPTVYYSNEHVIIMDFVETQYSIDANGQSNAAEVLAELHRITTKNYGFERDTLVGALRQPNPETPDWRAFFGQHRLIYMAGEALKEKKIDAKMMKQVEKLVDKLDKYITTPNPPGLVHGDVWGGNLLINKGRVAAFVDPAIYFADPEIELAFIKSFNTFDDFFFRRYAELNPIKPGFFEERAELYSLYPLLVHTRLFGLSYARKAQRILDKFV